MAQTIKLKRSATQGAVPSTSSLALGELAINTYDGKIFIKKDDGSEAIVTIGELSDNSVTAAKIATGAVGASELASTGVTAGSYGSSSAIPVVTVDADGRVTSLTTASISGLSANSVTATEIATDAVGASEIAANSVGISELNVTDGSSGQVLKTDGAGNLSFGDGGGATSQSFNVNTATGDGSTTDFTLSTTPSSEAMIIAFIDGVFQNQDSYTFSGTTLSFDTAPGNGTTVTVYVVGSIYSGNSVVLDTFSGDGSTTAFTLTQNPQNENNTQIYIDGVYQQKSQYSVSGTTLTFSSAPPSGTSNIEVIAFTSTNFSVLNANSVTSASIAANSVGTSELDMANITFSTLDVATTTTDDSVTITTTEDSSAAAPVVTLKRNSASPADADYLGQIKFKGENDADQEVVYAKITGKIQDNTDTTEDGIIEFANIKDGSQTITVRLKSDEMQLLNSTGLNVAGTTVLSGLTYPTSDGTNGQYLQTNGSGTLSFSTVSGYTDSDVETYLDGGTSTPTFASATVSGDLTVDTSTLYVDSTNNRVGIGTTSPADELDISSTGPGIRLTDTTTSGLYHTIVSASDDLLISADAGNVGASTEIEFAIDGTERMRIDSSGNLLVGTTSTNLYLSSDGSEGVRIAEDHVSIAGDQRTLLYLNRQTTDGEIVRLLKDGTTVGSIATNSGYLVIGSPVGSDGHLLIGNNLVHPATSTGATKDASIDIGGSTNRFKDLYLSNTINMANNVALNMRNAADSANYRALRVNTSNNLELHDGKVVIEPAGNVGIGTSSPQNPLEILTTNKLGTTFTGGTDGEGIRITQSNYTAGNHISLIEASYDDESSTPDARIGAMFNSSGSWLKFGTSNNYSTGITNTAMTIDYSGNVGIGTDTPAHLLQVFNTTAADDRTVASIAGQGNAGSSSTGGQYLAIYRSGAISGSSNNHAGGILLGISNSLSAANCGIRGTYEYTNGRDLQFFTSSGNTSTPVTRMTLKGNGTLEFGDTANSRPALAHKNFGYSSAWKGLLIGSSDTNYQADAVSVWFNVDLSANTSGNYGGDGSEIFFRNGTYFKTPNSSNNNYHTYIRMLDNLVGIGVTTPTSKLHVDAGTFAGYAVDLVQGGSGGGNHGLRVVSGSSSSYTAIFRANASTVFYVDGAGNYYFSGSSQSDVNKKENIADITDSALDLITQLQPKTYNFIGSDVDKAGFIAQEMETVIPRLVSGNEFDPDAADEDGNNPTGKGIDYMGYTAYLTKAIQELTAKLEAAEARIETLENN